jgi:hypothetical protein
MKYCRYCKLRAKDDGVTCAQCRRPLSVFGARPAASSGAPSTPSQGFLTLQGQLRQLETVHRRNLLRTRVLALVCSGVFLALLLTLYLVYHYTVLSYAVLKNIQIEQDRSQQREIRVSFEVAKPGKVAFDRRSGKNWTEKFDVYSKEGPVTWRWTWPSDPTTGIDFQVVSRGGLTRDTVAKHFAVTEAEMMPLRR